VVPGAIGVTVRDRDVERLEAENAPTYVPDCAGALHEVANVMHYSAGAIAAARGSASRFKVARMSPQPVADTTISWPRSHQT
jgi:hypothetical protein